MTEDAQRELQLEHQKEDDALIDRAIKDLLDSESGRRFFWSALGLGGLFNNAFIAGDGAGTAFRLVRCCCWR